MNKLLRGVLLILVLVSILFICCICRKINLDNFINNNKYTKDKKFTAIIQNHNRPKLAENLIKKLQNNPLIDEILLLESIPENFIKNVPPNTKKFNCVEANKKYGVKQRFMYAKHAKNEYLLYIDDDMDVPISTISVLLNKLDQEPDIIHGVYGRPESYNYWINDILYKLNLQPLEKEIDIVLTKILAVTKKNVQLFVDYNHIVEDIASKSPGVKWNGEDIFLSMIVKYNNKNKKNKIYPLYVNNDLGTKGGISGNKNHMKYRKNFIKIIKKRLL